MNVKPLKFSSKTHKLLWISDQHCQHAPLWPDSPYQVRGFTSIQEHDAWVKEQWFKLVGENTIVFNLGDVVFKDPKGEWFRQFTNWPGQQYLLNGNHLSGMKQIYRENLPKDLVGNVYPLKVNNVIFAGDNLSALIDGVPVYMQHYAPFIWPECGHGGYALCGHSHGNCAVLNPDDTAFGRVLDIGLDNAIKFNHTPFFTWEEIKTIMEKKPIRSKDHH